MLTAEDARHKR